MRYENPSAAPALTVSARRAGQVSADLLRQAPAIVYVPAAELAAHPECVKARSRENLSQLQLKGGGSGNKTQTLEFLQGLSIENRKTVVENRSGQCACEGDNILTDRKGERGLLSSIPYHSTPR